MGEAVKLPVKPPRFQRLRRWWRRTSNYRELAGVALVGLLFIAAAFADVSWLYAVPVRFCLFVLGAACVLVAVFFALEDIR